MLRKGLIFICIIVISIESLFLYRYHHISSASLNQSVNKGEITQVLNDRNQIKDLNNKLISDEQIIETYKMNVTTYIEALDWLHKNINTKLPLLTYSNEEEHQALLYALQYIKTQKVNGHSIPEDGEIIASMDIKKADKPYGYAINVYTYEFQKKNISKLPISADIRFGKHYGLNVKKGAKGWTIVNEGDQTITRIS